MTSEARPLEGIFVLDLAWVVAGPAMGRVLADYGADVIRVESATRVCTSRFIGPFPDGKVNIQRSACYDECNSGKAGLSLDLNVPEAREVVRDLARDADVVVESFAPGRMDKWGLSYAALSKDNPQMVMVSSSLMGQTGPFASFAGYGNVGAAVSGFQALVGHPDQPPVGPFGPYTDFIAPRLGLFALLAALDNRRKTGKGCRIDLSHVESALQFLAPQVMDCAATGRVPRLLGNRSESMAPHGVFECAGEDRWVAIAVRSDAEWAKLAQLIGGEAADARFDTLRGRKVDEDRLEELVIAWTEQRSAAEVEDALQSLGVPTYMVLGVDDGVADVQLRHRGHFVHLTREDGSTSIVEASRFNLSKTPAQTIRPAPEIGQHTFDLLRNRLGYDEARVTALVAAGALR